MLLLFCRQINHRSGSVEQLRDGQLIYFSGSGK